MPPAKSDLAAWRRRQRNGDQGDAAETSGVTTKLACIACRSAKIRCLLDGTDGQACSRCSRLGLECAVQPHRKGRPKRVEIEQRPFNGSSNGHSAMMFGTSVASDAAHQQQQDYSTSSLFHVHDDDSLRRLRSTAMALQLLRSGNDVDNAAGESKHVDVFTAAPSPGQVEDIALSGLLSDDEVHTCVTFYFVRLNGNIALLTPSLNTYDALRRNANAAFLLCAICVVSTRFLWPRRYVDVSAFAERFVHRFQSGTLTASLEHCQAFSILSMWRLPTDPTGWRKLHAAITIAFELNLHKLAGRLVQPHEDVVVLAQRQRTMFQLCCTEEHFRVQRRIPALLNTTVLPDPRAWIESLGEHCLDIDVRIAAAIDQISVFRRSQTQLATIGEQPTWEVCMQQMRVLRAARADQVFTASMWIDATEYGIPQPFANRPCGVFNSAHHDFNYVQGMMAIYARPEMASRTPKIEVASTFQQAVELSCVLIESLRGQLGHDEYYRYVHDSTICSLATTALWIVDHYARMMVADAARAKAAMESALKATQASQDRWHEQSAYLHRVFEYCCTKLAGVQAGGEDDGDQAHLDSMVEWIMSLLPATVPATLPTWMSTMVAEQQLNGQVG